MSGNTITDEIIAFKLQKRLLYNDLLNSDFSDIYCTVSDKIKSVKPRQILFHVEKNCCDIPTCECGNSLSWNDDLRSYRQYCSKKCTAKYTVAAKKLDRVSRGLPEWHSQETDWSDKIKNTSRKRYGVDHYSKTEEFTNRVTDTNNITFGAAYPTQSSLGKARMRQAFVDKYGVDNPAKVKTIRTKQAETWIKNHYSPEALLFMTDDEIFKTEIMTAPVSELASRYGISRYPIYSKVNELGLVLPTFKTNYFEQSVVDYIKSTYSSEDIIQSDWSVLTNRQLDIYLPKLNLAIECNGTYWHSESRGRGKGYHVQKTIDCSNQSIQLLHIWEHDWNDKRPIIESLLSVKMGIAARVFARDTTVKVIERKPANDFFDATHLQGSCGGNTVNIGLFDSNSKLMSAMSFGRCRFGNKAQWELLRFSTILGHTIVGGASKLFKYFISTQNPNSVLSYADRSYATGNVYTKLGFTHTGTTKPGYRYTLDYVKIYSRQHFQKHKLKKRLLKYDQELSERQNMANSGYDRIWDCGNNVYVWKS